MLVWASSSGSETGEEVSYDHVTEGTTGWQPTKQSAKMLASVDTARSSVLLILPLWKQLGVLQSLEAGTRVSCVRQV